MMTMAVICLVLTAFEFLAMIIVEHKINITDLLNIILINRKEDDK